MRTDGEGQDDDDNDDDGDDDDVAIGIPDFVAMLPERVWYLTSTGQDMWCRRPYGFFFTSSEAAGQFAAAIPTQFALQPIGIASRELISDEGVAALRRLEVTRIFVDPQFDPGSGDVHGAILRIAPLQ